MTPLTMTEEPLRIEVPGAGEVSALRTSPGGESARWLFIYAPGAGSNLRDPFGAFAATPLAEAGSAMLRMQFPYMEAGRRGPDRPKTLQATWRAVVEAVRDPRLRLVVGGRSMGGRVGSQVVAQEVDADALALFAYPLHAPGRTGTWRDEHFPAIGAPTLLCSGTRDAFVELAMESGCKTFPSILAMKKTDKMKYKAICHSIREDGAFIDAGENDNLIVQKLKSNPAALGVFGFSFLDQNRDKVQGSLVDKAEPSFDNISSGKYPVSRSLYFYVKNAHVGIVPGIAEYIDAFTSETAWGPYGYLADRGLIPLPVEEREKVRSGAMSLTPYAK